MLISPFSEIFLKEGVAMADSLFEIIQKEGVESVLLYEIISEVGK